MPRFRLLATAVALALATTSPVTAMAAQATPGTAGTPADVPLGQLPRTVVPSRVELELKIDPAKPRFSGTTRIHATVAEATDTIWMHGRGLDIAKAEVVLADGARIVLTPAEAHVSGILKMAAASTVPAGKATIEIAYDAAFGELQGAYRVSPDGDQYVITQMEPLGARTTFPGFDEPSFKQPWDITLIVPSDLAAVANAPEADSQDLGDGWKRVTFERTEALPSYLVAFAVGPWDLKAGPAIPANGARKAPIELRGVAARGKGGRMQYSLDNTPVIVTALEDYFGIPYPFAKLDNLAAPDFWAGAMENAGLIVYRDTLMFPDEASAVSRRQSFWGVSAHELAHQWFGDLVTMEWWDDLWLNEAFATWMGNKITGQLQPEFHTDRRLLEGALYAMDADSLASTRRIHQPIADFTQIQSAFDGITYQKGGAVLSMFENYVGEQNFRAGIHDYLVEHARGNATSADLIDAVAARSDDAPAVKQAFESFIDQPGVPLVDVDLDCVDGKPPALVVKQQRYVPIGSTASASQTWGIPMCVRYGADGEVGEQCGMVTGAESRLVLEKASACPAWVMPNAHGQGYYRFSLAPALRTALGDGFAQLDEREQRVYADSIIAAYGAGKLTPTELVQALPQLANAPVRETVAAPIGEIAWMEEHLYPDEAARQPFREGIAAIYRPRLQALGMSFDDADSDDTRLLRARLIGFFANTLRDETVRKELALQGRAVLGLDGNGVLDADAAPRDIRDLALEVAVQEGGQPAFDKALAHLKATQDAELRGQLLGALGSSRDPALAERARGLVLEEGLLRRNEIATVLNPQTDDVDGREALRTWLDEHFEVLAAKVAPAGARLIGVASPGMCSEPEAAALQQQFEERMTTVEGGPLQLKQSVEAIRLCAAARQARAGQAVSFPLPGSTDGK